MFEIRIAFEFCLWELYVIGFSKQTVNLDKHFNWTKKAESYLFVYLFKFLKPI